ncbi:KLHL21 [Branchiostoma lanceolatum]|uniref:KLHL21 protein n=1 Tax=Branchiostoma lanceolatum TaxID=7740 RepID=A0A8K0AAL9_BRALA|nr:KLHL21 [Branchiostoma lanceolatum]
MMMGSPVQKMRSYCDRDEDHNWHQHCNDFYNYHEDGSCSFGNRCNIHALHTELTRQRKTGEFVDVVVEVEGREYSCHRAVLATVPYFKAMFSTNLLESKAKVITLHDIDSSSFSKLLDFVYTGEIQIGKDDVQDILQVAHMLQVEQVLEYCDMFIQRNLCPSNCVGVMLLADMYGLSSLKTTARHLAMTYFSEVRQSEGFLNLSTKQLLDLLGDKELQVASEDEIALSVMQWLDHESESRKTEVSRILPVIRLPFVRVSVLKKLESHPAVVESDEWLAKITAAKEGHLDGSSHQLMADAGREETERQPRCGLSDDLAIIVGGWKAVTQQDYSANPTPPAPLQSLICIDPDSKQCYHVSDLPTSIHGSMGVASAGHYLYVTGGCALSCLHPDPPGGNKPSKQTFRYDFSTDTWARLPDMPRGRAGHQSVILDGKLFLVGGNTEATFFNMFSMDCYAIEEGAWIKPPTVPAMKPSPNLTVIPCGGKIVLIQVLRKKNDLSVHSFNVNTEHWTCSYEYNYAPTTRDIDMDIRANTIGNKVHFCTTTRKKYDCNFTVYTYDGEKETPSIKLEDRKVFKEEIGVVHGLCRFRKRYVKGQESIINTISRTTYGTRTRLYSVNKQTTQMLPFALFGQRFLATKKGSVGWYCRDLPKVEKDHQDVEPYYDSYYGYSESSDEDTY